jgi:hypothetical protein
MQIRAHCEYNEKQWVEQLHWLYGPAPGHELVIPRRAGVKHAKEGVQTIKTRQHREKTSRNEHSPLII